MQGRRKGNFFRLGLGCRAVCSRRASALVTLAKPRHWCLVRCEPGQSFQGLVQQPVANVGARRGKALLTAACCCAPFLHPLLLYHHVALAQVLLYTPARQKGGWSQQHRAYVVKHSKLRHFVDSHWNLNTGALASTEPAVSDTNSSTSRAKAAPLHGSRGEPGALPRAAPAAVSATLQSQAPKHVLHFVAYVPPAAQRPLLLLLPNGTPSPTNSFHIPAWGGLHVVNPSSSNSSSSEQKASSGCTAPGLQGLCTARAAAQPLAQPDMARLARAVVSQLRALLRLELREGLTSAAFHQQARSEGQAEAAAHALHVDAAPALETGFSSWEVDVLLRQRAQHSAVTAARVLGSLSRLVEQLPTLEMPDLIGDQVRLSSVSSIS